MENRFGIGAVLGTGFKIWFKNLPAFLLITLVVYIPLIIWGVQVSSSLGGAEGFGMLDQIERVAKFEQYSTFAALLLNLFAAAAITYGVVMELQGQHAGIGACFATGLARFFPVLGVAILSTLCVALGFLLLIVPGIIVFCMFYVSTPAAVLERPGVTGALGRSKELTQGHKLEIFGLLFLVGLINAGVSYVANQVIVDVDSLGSSLTNVAGVLRRYIYVQLALNIVIGSLGAVMSAVSYYYLRSEKEGTSANELARIFD